MRMKKKAFTLIEVLAAIAVLAIVLPTVMYGISLASNLASISKRRQEATTLAQTKMNEILITQDWQSGSTAGDFGDDAPGYKWSSEVTSYDDSVVTTLEQVDVHVTWNQRNEQHEVVISTLVNTSTSTGMNSSLPTGGL